MALLPKGTESNNKHNNVKMLVSDQFFLNVPTLWHFFLQPRESHYERVNSLTQDVTRIK